MPEGFDKKTSLWMNSDDYVRVEELAKTHARRASDILRAAIVLGCEVIEKQGDKAIKRALGGAEGEER
ncbi:MAG: hypothetical protein KIT58_04455 [Planctomycetota bacterium]|nr:hypothetical protein [Planctomycetota bacterium]